MHLFFSAKNRVAHRTNFSDPVQLVISCVADDLQRFLHDEVRNNARYTSTTTITDFIHAIAQWAERGLLQSLKQSPYYTLWEMNVVMCHLWKSYCCALDG